MNHTCQIMPKISKQACFDSLQVETSSFQVQSGMFVRNYNFEMSDGDQVWQFDW